jgi:hypothetical protein
MNTSLHADIFFHHNTSASELMEPASQDKSNSPPSSSSPQSPSPQPSTAREEGRQDAAFSTLKAPTISRGRVSRGHLTKSDIECIVSWLENPTNFASIYGTPGKTCIGRPIRTATKGYEELARRLHSKSRGRLTLSPKAKMLSNENHT